MYTSSASNLPAQAPVAAETAALRIAAPEERALIQAVRAINVSGFFGQENELSFVVDRNTRRTVVRIVNRETREVVKSIPDGYVLRLAEEIKEK